MVPLSKTEQPVGNSRFNEYLISSLKRFLRQGCSAPIIDTSVVPQLKPRGRADATRQTHAHCSVLPTKVMSWSTLGGRRHVTGSLRSAMSRRRPNTRHPIGYSFTGARVGVWGRSPSSFSGRAVSERATRTERDLSVTIPRTSRASERVRGLGAKPPDLSFPRHR
jgi:hypothetical protein